MTSPFVDVQVSPSYGKNTCVVNWMLLPQYLDGMVFVFRSTDGVRFDLLNEQPLIRAAYYIDETMPADNRIDMIYYRLLLVHTTGEYDSPIIGFFDKINRYEYGLVHSIIQKEFLKMRSGQGLEILYYCPLTAGTPCEFVDIESQQVTGAECEDGSGDPTQDCYGQKFKGGFAAPVKTWMKIQESGPIVIIDSEVGLGQVDEYTAQARMLAFPRPKRDDLIIHVPTDNRYAIGEVVKPYMFKGIVPVAYEVKLHLLRRDDPRYRVPVPNK